MIIEQDLTQTSDTREKIPAGNYECVIKGEQTKPPKNPETKGQNLVLDLEIVNHPEHSGRSLTHYVFLPADTSRKDALTGVKRVFLSAGIPVGRGMDTRLLVGKTIAVRVDNGVIKDDRSGQLKETYSVGEVYIPADNVQINRGNGGVAPQSSAASVANILGGAPAPAPATPTPTPVPTSPLPA